MRAYSLSSSQLVLKLVVFSMADSSGKHVYFMRFSLFLTSFLFVGKYRYFPSMVEDCVRIYVTSFVKVAIVFQRSCKKHEDFTQFWRGSANFACATAGGRLRSDRHNSARWPGAHKPYERWKRHKLMLTLPWAYRGGCSGTWTSRTWMRSATPASSSAECWRWASGRTGVPWSDTTAWTALWPNADRCGP